MNFILHFMISSKKSRRFNFYLGCTTINIHSKRLSLLFQMKFYQSIFFLAAIAFCYFISVLSTGCAQIGMPTGGPRDSTPPVLLNATPPNNTIHFKGKNIVLTFDEYVHLQDMQKNLLVAPEPKIIPNITSKLKNGFY